MKFTDIFVQRPVLATVVSLMILVVGLRAAMSLPILQYPRTENAVITVSTAYFGADPDVVAGFITAPLENAVAQASGIDYMTSSSTAGFSTITARLQLNYDYNAAMSEISARVDSVTDRLPPQAQNPSISVQVGDGPVEVFMSDRLKTKIDTRDLLDGETTVTVIATDVDGYEYDWMAVVIMTMYGASWLLGLFVQARWRYHPPPPRIAASDQRNPVSGSSAILATSLNKTTATPPTTRTLTIMFIDMEDYTTRTAHSSRGAIIELIQRLRRLVQPIVQQRGGHIVKTMGDGLLVTFDSPTEAVLTGRDIQQAVKKQNVAVDENEAMALRIGVSTGEVTMQDNDILGKPVNVASRIEQLAEPGQVFFSEATYHSMTESEVPHEPAGEFDIKGVGDNVRIYRVK